VLSSGAVPGVFYFAYGSNMDSATLRGRRGIEWSRAVPALLRGWRLVLDKPSLFRAGSAMASIVADAGAEVWGVLYEISGSDLEHLELTEGVRIRHYQRIVVELQPSSGDGSPTTAVTLASGHRDPEARPTTRYMSLLLAGAAEHGLPQTWIETLRAIEAVEESDESAAILPFLDQALRKPS